MTALAHPLLALGRTTAPAAPAKASRWTTAQARAALVSASPLYLVDRAAADEPVYELRIRRPAARQLRPAGAARLVRGVRTWPKFVFAGTAPDEVSGPVAVRFVILPRGRPGPRHFALRGFRGPPPNRFQPAYLRLNGRFVVFVYHDSQDGCGMAGRWAQASQVVPAYIVLVVSFSEWGEGTAVESAREWASASGFGAYLDALYDDGAP